MNQWVYKATKAKIDDFDTLYLATKRNFLYRSAIEPDGSHADRVAEVELGDIIHFFYSRGGGKVPPYRSFEVIDGASYPARFGDRIDGTALFRVREDADNADMIDLLTKEHARDPKRGYMRDPEHDCFTGWVIQRLDSTVMKPPAFDQKKLFPGPRTSLWHYPDPALPKEAPCLMPRCARPSLVREHPRGGSQAEDACEEGREEGRRRADPLRRVFEAAWARVGRLGRCGLSSGRRTCSASPQRAEPPSTFPAARDRRARACLGGTPA